MRSRLIHRARLTTGINAMSVPCRARFLAAASMSILPRAAGLAAAGSAYAAEASAAEADQSHGPKVIESDVAEVLVVAPRTDAAQGAPVKSSLQATEPQAVIDRAFIEQNTPVIGDYTTTSSLAVSMVSAGNPN